MEGVYATFSSISPSGSLTVNIGDTTPVTTTWTEIQPTITGGPAGYWDSSPGVVYTTGRWDYTYNGTSNTDVQFYQSSSEIYRHLYVTVRTASVSTITSAYTKLIYGESMTLGGGASVNASGIYSATVWTDSTGRSSLLGTFPVPFTAPLSGSSVTITAALANTDGSINTTKLIELYEASTLSSYSIDGWTVLPGPGVGIVNLPYGAPFRLKATFSGSGSTGSIDQGVGSLISDTWTNYITANWSTTGASRNYTVTIANPSGSRNNKSNYIVIVPAVVSISGLAPTNQQVTVGTPVAYSATVTNAYNSGVTWSHSGGTGSWVSNTFTPSNASVSGVQYTITATSTGEPTKATSTSLYSYAAPVATSITAVSSEGSSSSLLAVNWDENFTLTPVYSNGKPVNPATITYTGGSVVCPATGVTSSPISASTFTGTRRYTLTVTNTPGTTDTKYVDVQRRTVSLGAIIASALTVATSGSLQFQVPTITGATNTRVNWTATGGSFSSSQTEKAVNTFWTAPSTPGTYTITATSDASSSVFVSTTVLVVSLGQLNGGSSCIIGGAYSLNGGGFTGGTGVSLVKINGVTASYGTVTDSTISNITVPQMSTYGSVPVAVTINGVATTTSGNIAVPSLSSIVATPSSFNEDSTTTLSSTVSNLFNTNINWSATGSTGGLTGFSPQQTTSGGTTVWTPPSISTTPQSYSITATADGNPSTQTVTSVTVHKLPIATSLTANITSVPYDGSFTLTPSYLYGSGSIDWGVANNGNGVATNPISVSSFTGTRRYTLTVTNPKGSTATTYVDITRQSVTIGAIYPQDQEVATTATLSVKVDSLTGAVDTRVVWSSWLSSDPSKAQVGSFSPSTSDYSTYTVWTPPAAAGTYTIKAASIADPTKFVTTTVTVISSTGTFVLNEGYACNIGSMYNITGTGFTSGSGVQAIKFNGVSTTWGNVTSTQISNVVIPPLSSYGTVTISITISSVTQYGSGVVSTPYLTPVSPSTLTLTEGATGTFTSTTANLGNTGISWSATGSTGVGTWSGNVWTSPYPSTSPQTYTIQATASGNPSTIATATATVHKVPLANSLTVSPYYSGGITGPTGTMGLDVGSKIILIPNFSYATKSAYIGTTIGGAEVTNDARTNISSTPQEVGVDMNQVYYLTVMNTPGTSAYVASGQVVANPISVSSITPSTISVTKGSFTPELQATVTGVISELSTVSWSYYSATGTGTWSGSKFKPLSGSITGLPYTLIATSTKDITKTSSIDITAYDVPTGTMAIKLGGSTVSQVPYGAVVTIIPTFSGTYHSYLGTAGDKSTDIGYDFISGSVFTYTMEGPSGTDPNNFQVTFSLYLENYIGDYHKTQITIKTGEVLIGAIEPATLDTMVAGTEKSFQLPAVSGNAKNIWTATGGSFRPIDTNGDASSPNGGPIYWTAPKTTGYYTITATTSLGAIATKVIEVTPVQTLDSTTTTGIGGVEKAPDTVGNLIVGKMLYVGPGGVLTQDYGYVKQNCRWIIGIGRATAVNKFIFAPSLPIDQRAGSLGDLNESPFSFVNGSYKFVQSEVSSVWTITHNQNRYWNTVQVFDTSTGGEGYPDHEVGMEIPRDVTFPDLNTMVIRLIVPANGYVLCS